MQVLHPLNLIASDPAVRSGRPFIVGTTVTVADIVTVMLYHNQDADGLAAWFDVTLAQVHGALAYYYDHREDIDEQIRAQIRRAEALAERRPGGEHSLLP